MTDNFQIWKQWSMIVPATKETFLISWNNTQKVEFYVTETERDRPTDGLFGHALTSGEALTRNTIGPGFICARILDGDDDDFLTLIIS